MNALAAIAAVWVGAALLMTAAWTVQRATRNAGWVDASWAAGLALAALFYGVVGSGSTPLRPVLALLAALWGFRLCLQVLRRVLNEPEDGRYARLRRHWQDHQGRFFLYFQVQALAVALLSLPFVAVAWNQRPHWPWVAVGVAIWMGALCGQALADLQLARRRQRGGHEPRAPREGLWRGSRQPIHDFAWLHWVGYVPMAIGSPLAWLSLAGPTLVFAALIWRSVMAPAPAQAPRSDGGDALDQREGSHCLAWPPRAPG